MSAKYEGLKVSDTMAALIAHWAKRGVGVEVMGRKISESTGRSAHAATYRVGFEGAPGAWRYCYGEAELLATCQGIEMGLRLAAHQRRPRDLADLIAEDLRIKELEQS